MARSKDTSTHPLENTGDAAPVDPTSDGAVRTFVTLGAGIGDSTITALMGSVEDLRTSLFERARSSIDWVETMQRANIDLARRLTDRADGLSRSVVDATREALGAVVATSRSTGHGAAELATRSVSSIFGRADNQAA